MTDQEQGSILLEPTITVGPEEAASLAELTTLTIDGVTFRTGDAVWLEHIPTGSRLYGTLGAFFGVGRIRGIHVATPFVGQASFYFGKPGDAEKYRLEHIPEERA